MPLAGLEALYFDIDGTLCRYGARPATVLAQVTEALDIDARIDHEAYYALYREIARETGRGYESVSNEAYRRLLARQGYEDAELARRVAERYRAIRLESLALYPETREVLEALHGRLKLGVISNGPSEIQWAKLSRFGLRDYFDDVVISGDVGVDKPDESIFRLALERLGARPEASAHVGDDPSADVAGATHAGMRALWVNRGVLAFEPGEPAPHHEIQDLREILSLLDG